MMPSPPSVKQNSALWYKFDWFYHVFGALVGIGLLVACLWTANRLARAILLYLGLAFGLVALFRGLRLLVPTLPDGHLKRLGSASALAITAAVTLTWTLGPVWIVVACAAVVAGVIAVGSGLQHVLVEYVLIDAFSRAYASGTLPRTSVPTIYLLAEFGFGNYYGQRFVTKMTHVMWKYRLLSPKTGLSVFSGHQISKRRHGPLWLDRQRASVLFLSADSLRGHSSEFRRWAIHHTAAFMVVRTPFGSRKKAEFDREAKFGFARSPGPTFDIVVRPQGRGNAPQDPRADAGVTVDWGLRDAPMEDIIAEVTNRLVATAVPIATSDTQLPESHRVIARMLSSGGFPPIADSYSRFRLAQSDVERFIAMVDAVECLTRCSALFLLADCWGRGQTHPTEAELTGRRPLTFGSWHRILDRLIREASSKEGVIATLTSWWASECNDVEEAFTERAAQSGVTVAKRRTNRRLEWLQWFVEMRNVTKGHGVLEEETVAGLWHPLHELFLGMLVELREVVLLRLIACGASSHWKMGGWTRGDIRAKSLKQYSVSGTEVVSCIQVAEQRVLCLYPLVTVVEGVAMIWDRVGPSGVEYLRYSSSERGHVGLAAEGSRLDLRSLWMTGRDRLSPLLQQVLSDGKGRCRDSATDSIVDSEGTAR